MTVFGSSRSQQPSDTAAPVTERVFASNRRGTTIRVGDFVLHRGKTRRVVALEDGEGPAVAVVADDGAAALGERIASSELELIL
jgi:hypothetical protein